MRPVRLFGLAVTALLLLAACGGDDDGAVPASTPGSGSDAVDAVLIEDFKFQPTELTVKAGSTVTITNADDAPHTLTASDGSFDSGNLAGGEEGSVTLDEPGEHAFRCEIHQYMRGTVTVE